MTEGWLPLASPVMAAWSPELGPAQAVSAVHLGLLPPSFVTFSRTSDAGHAFSSCASPPTCLVDRV